MEIKEFKKYLHLRRVLRVKFLNHDGIERKFGWRHNHQNSLDSAVQDKEMCEIYYKKNDLKRKLMALKGMTKYLDYKCDFKNGGGCRGTRQRNPHWSRSSGCCCRDCRRELGYIKFVPEHAIAYLAERFGEHGFYKVGEGCQIEDRSLRSETCLRYSCHPDQEFKDMFYNYGNQIRVLEDRIQELQRKETRLIKKRQQQKNA